MARGSCLCGAVAFEIDDEGVVVSVACYCTNCRKVSGGQYRVYLQVRRDAFRWLAGEDRVAAYESSPGNTRALRTAPSAFRAAPRVFEDTGPPAFWAGVMQRLFAAR